MGLDAFVHCRCHRDGAAASPPTAVVYGADGLECEGSVSLQDQLAFDRWLQTGCRHPGMQLASERVGNWSYYRMFQGAMSQVGLERLPTLARELPDTNGGATSPTDARQCLFELAVFETAYEAPAAFRLVDADTGAELASRVDAYDGVFFLGGRDNVQAGIDADGLFFVRRARGGAADDGALLFRAAEFTQRVESSVDEADRVLLSSPDGEMLVLSGGLPLPGAEPGSQLPMRLRVVSERLDDDYFAEIVAALRRIFITAVEADMPVQWT